MVKIAINGFGRIGRAAFKVAIKNSGVEVVGINDLCDTKTLAHLLKYDTVYGIFEHEVSYDDGHIIVDGKAYSVTAEKDPANLPWSEQEVDVVLECTGIFRDEEQVSAHLKAGAKKVIISAPPKGGDVEIIVLGVNDEKIKEVKNNIYSNASCTTNCIAPIAKVIQSEFGVLKVAMTTIHGYTQDQNLHDAPHKDLRRARAAAVNMVPTSTGAAIATTKCIPVLKGLFDGFAVRVPVPVGSLADYTFLISRKTTIEEINSAFKKAASSDSYKGILVVTEDPIVSSDIVGNSASSIVDLGLTNVIDGDLVKVVAWYDNEWGYSSRLVELAVKVMGK